jgi:hypothetical protein
MNELPVAMAPVSFPDRCGVSLTQAGLDDPPISGIGRQHGVALTPDQEVISARARHGGLARRPHARLFHDSSGARVDQGGPRQGGRNGMQSQADQTPRLAQHARCEDGRDWSLSR